MTTIRSNTEFEKRKALQDEAVRRRNRRRADIEAMLTGQSVVRAKVTGQEVSLFLDSHTVVKAGLASSDTGRMIFSWKSLDTLKTEDDFKK